jgi:hypothetical protein
MDATGENSVLKCVFLRIYLIETESKTAIAEMDVVPLRPPITQLTILMIARWSFRYYNGRVCVLEY